MTRVREQQHQQRWQPCETHHPPGAGEQLPSAADTSSSGRQFVKCAHFTSDPARAHHTHALRRSPANAVMSSRRAKGTVASRGLKRLKQTLIPCPTLAQDGRVVFVFSKVFYRADLLPLVPALSKMTSFLSKMGDLFRQDGSLMSVCSHHPQELAGQLSHAEASPPEEHT